MVGRSVSRLVICMCAYYRCCSLPAPLPFRSPTYSILLLPLRLHNHSDPTPRCIICSSSMVVRARYAIRDTIPCTL
ncbi:hypothetical protein B0H14DRAFT_2976780 [Mycena olivaceomarginata]|nr:hypothetical protein B0H14DRAFT_2976780 [Mycena olivaceomarginata]